MEKNVKIDMVKALKFVFKVPKITLDVILYTVYVQIFVCTRFCEFGT